MNGWSHEEKMDVKWWNGWTERRAKRNGNGEKNGEMVNGIGNFLVSTVACKAPKLFNKSGGLLPAICEIRHTGNLQSTLETLSSLY